MDLSFIGGSVFMGNAKIRKMMRKPRITDGKADHKHSYSVPVWLELRRCNEQSQYLRSDWYDALKCDKCEALEIQGFVSPETREAENHKDRESLGHERAVVVKTVNKKFLMMF